MDEVWSQQSYLFVAENTLISILFYKQLIFLSYKWKCPSLDCYYEQVEWTICLGSRHNEQSDCQDYIWLSSKDS